MTVATTQPNRRLVGPWDPPRVRPQSTPSQAPINPQSTPSQPPISPQSTPSQPPGNPTPPPPPGSRSASCSAESAQNQRGSVQSLWRSDRRCARPVCFLPLTPIHPHMSHTPILPTHHRDLYPYIVFLSLTPIHPHMSHSHSSHISPNISPKLSFSRQTRALPPQRPSSKRPSPR